MADFEAWSNNASKDYLANLDLGSIAKMFAVIVFILGFHIRVLSHTLSVHASNKTPEF